jgi:hypothetical protein
MGSIASYTRGELEAPEDPNQEDRYRRERRQEIEAIQAMPEGCDGYEELPQEVIETFRDLKEYSDAKSLVGYRCRKTGEAVVAITWESGIVGLHPLNEDLTPVIFFDDEMSETVT